MLLYFLIVAFRWPMKHKIFVTRQRVYIIIGISWLLSATPVIVGVLHDTVLPKMADESVCYREQGYCWKNYYYNFIDPQHNWIETLPGVIAAIILLVTTVTFYGYLLVIIHGVSERNPGFRKKRTVVVTSLCLVVSFFLSYAYYIFRRIYFVAVQDYEADLLESIRKYFNRMCPACPLILDFLLTGMIGAIMDPIIYCLRIREIRIAFSNLCKNRLFLRRPSFTSGSGYVRAGQNSITVDENL